MTEAMCNPNEENDLKVSLENYATRKKSFEDAARPLIKWLNDNWHPHVAVVVTSTSAELLVSEMMFRAEDYLRS